jgi:hypothetical protein
MAIYQYVALTCAVAGREREYDDWYNGRHVVDVAAVPGVKSAKRFPIISTTAEGGLSAKWRSFALYEIETDGNPEDVIAAIRKRHGTPLMPATDTLDQRGMIQILAGPVAATAGNV